MGRCGRLGLAVFAIVGIGGQAEARAPDWSGPRGAQRTTVDLGPSPRLGRHAVLDDVDPGAIPIDWKSEPLSIVASPRERERAGFVVYAGARGGRLTVEVDELRGPAGVLPSSAIRLRSVKRTAMRRQFNRDGTELVGRFAPVFEPHALKARTFEEVWVEATLPADAGPGRYHGTLRVTVGEQRFRRPLRVRVRPITLQRPRGKGLGMFYRAFARLDDEARVRRELADMREHGVDHLVLDLRPLFGWGPRRTLQVSTERMRRGLALVQEAGFAGTVVVDSGLVPLARMLGHDDVAYADARGDSLDTRPAPFEAGAAAALASVQTLAAERWGFEVAVMHLDEVFERDRLPLFERLAAVSRRESSLPIYATFSTAEPRYDDLRRRIDGLVDIRGHHGYSFEWWLLRGGTAASYRRELDRSGDTAWFYHNERGTYFTGRWARLVNGLYLWASPFSSHVTWAYQAFEGEPLDDGDGRGHDFGMSFPDPRDPDVLMPTRIWAAVEEGYDDLRYLATLEHALARHAKAAPGLATRARSFLDDLRDDVLQPPPGIDVDRLGSRVGTPAEAPLMDALASRYDDATLALIRARAEEFTVSLQVAGGGGSGSVAPREHSGA